ncbi:MAG: creatininase family protein [Pirellulaceae bacterium]
MKPQVLCACVSVILGAATAAAAPPSSRIVLVPQAGAMQVAARVPGLDNQGFALGIPETLGCREAMLVNFPEARVEWEGPDDDGAVACSWGPGGRVSYTLRLVPADDYVDLEMTIRNHTEFLWHDVFAFNCLNPINAPTFQDWKLERTYMSAQGKPLCMAQTTRVKGHMPTVGFYLPERITPGTESVFVRGFGATSPDRTDGSWIVTLSDPAGSYMAATAWEAAFLFGNLDRCCLHAAPSFGDIGPGEGSTTVSRIYLARGTLETFLQRQSADRPALAARQKWARPVDVVQGSKPHGRMEEMLPDQLEQILAEAPIAFVPVGTYEHHGFHLPVCFDGTKAHALCERVARHTGGTVLPTFFYGTGGGHVGYKWTLMLPEAQIAPLLAATLDHLARQGFKVVVLLTGHYPQEQVDMVHRLAQEAQQRHPEVTFIGLTEPEVTTPQPGDAYGGDHAAKYETSIAMALYPDLVRLDLLTPGRDPAQVALPDTPRKDAPTHDPTHPLYAIHGQDPRTRASKELGQKLVAEIVSRLARKVEEALAGKPESTATAKENGP